MSDTMTPAAAPVQPKPAGKPRRARGPFLDLRRDGLKIAIVLGVLVAANVIFWAVLVRPQQQKIAALFEQKQTAGLTEKQAQQQLELLQGIQTHVGSVETGVTQFYDEMLSTKRERMVPFQQALIRVGSKFQVQPQQVSVGHSELEQEGIQVFGWSFPLEGGYENLRRFLADLEKLDQFLLVREVSIRGDKSGKQALQLSVDIETYFNAPGMRDALARQRKWQEDNRKKNRRRRR